MYLKRLTALMLILFNLSACSPPPRSGPAINSADDSLAEASYAVSRSMTSLAETAEAAHPMPPLASPPAPASYGMGQLSTIDWSGPVEPLLEQIARASSYRLRVLGTAPAIPVLVSIYDKNMPLGDILRDVAYQCGRRAQVIVFFESRTIELRYAKN